jgi:Ser/Thr protein kinase RdoA (MazF antagonist)
MHADYRLDNFFFDDAAKRVVIIDWQLTVRGVGAQDVSYFILQSMTTEDRRAHDERLVRRWYDGLVANGVSDYSWDDAWTDFRRAALGQLTIAVIGAGSMDPGNDRGRALMDAMALRNFQGLVDYDCGALHLD